MYGWPRAVRKGLPTIHGWLHMRGQRVRAIHGWLRTRGQRVPAIHGLSAHVCTAGAHICTRIPAIHGWLAPARAACAATHGWPRAAREPPAAIHGLLPARCAAWPAIYGWLRACGQRVPEIHGVGAHVCHGRCTRVHTRVRNPWCGFTARRTLCPAGATSSRVRAAARPLLPLAPLAGRGWSKDQVRGRAKHDEPPLIRPSATFLPARGEKGDAKAGM
jgi:hypothetical protein